MDYIKIEKALIELFGKQYLDELKKRREFPWFVPDVKKESGSILDNQIVSTSCDISSTFESPVATYGELKKIKPLKKRNKQKLNSL